MPTKRLERFEPPLGCPRPLLGDLANVIGYKYKLATWKCNSNVTLSLAAFPLPLELRKT